MLLKPQSSAVGDGGGEGQTKRTNLMEFGMRRGLAPVLYRTRHSTSGSLHDNLPSLREAFFGERKQEI